MPGIQRRQLELAQRQRPVIEQIFDLLLQLDAVLAQDFRDLALLGRQASEHIVGQELRAFAQRGQRRFQLVRNLLEKTVFLLLEVDELTAHPFQPVARYSRSAGPETLTGVSNLPSPS